MKQCQSNKTHQIHRVNTLNLFENKTVEPRMTLNEFMNVQFRNNGIPDLMFLYVYVLFGELILEYFIKYVLKMNNKNSYFTLNPKFGLYLRSEDKPFVESEEFRQNAALYVNEFLKNQGKVTYFK